MAIFLSHSTTVIAKSIAFFCGSVLSVLVILTVIDEDVLSGRSSVLAAGVEPYRYNGAHTNLRN